MSSFNDRTADLLGEVLDVARKALKESESTGTGTYLVPAELMRDLHQAIRKYDKERGPGSPY